MCKSCAKKRERVPQEHSVPGGAGVSGGKEQLFWSVTHAPGEENPCAPSPGLAAGNCRGCYKQYPSFRIPCLALPVMKCMFVLNLKAAFTLVAPFQS